MDKPKPDFSKLGHNKEGFKVGEMSFKVSI